MRLTVRALVAVVVVAFGSLTGAIAQEAQRPSPVEYTLDNGLEVVLLPDQRVPKAAITLAYKVGSINEPVGRSGFAHLFEHLMFSGTTAWPDFDESYSALGLANNAFTTEDQTVYWGEGLASALPVMLSIEADRMANLGNAVEQSELDIQRDVVLNEMRQNVLDSPGGALMVAAKTGLFPKSHPYSRAVIGSIPDIEAAQLGDVKAFFNTFYVPNNAVLVIVGDFEVEAAKTLIDETLGLVPRGPEVSTLPYQPVPPARMRLDMEDRVPMAQVALAFAGPPYNDKKANAALWIAGELIGNYEYGVLRTELVNKGLATYGYAGWSPGQLGGQFMVGAAVGNGVEVEDLQAALTKTIADFLAKPVDPADVDRARSNYLLSDRVGMESYLNRAISVAVIAARGAEITALYDDVRGFAEVTVADVEAAMRQLLVLDDASIVILRPGARGNYPPVLSESSGEAVPLASVDRAPVAVPVLQATEPGLAIMPQEQTATLSNGIKVVHYQIAGAPRLYVAATVTGGGMNDPPGKEGLYSMAMSMASRGAGDLDLEAFSKAAKDLGADVGGLNGDQMSGILLSVPPETFEAAMPLFVEAVQRPRFDEGPWAVLVQETISGLMQRETDLERAASVALDDQIFFPAPGESAIHSSLESVRAITRDDAKAVFHKLFVPKAMTFYSVGDLPLADVVAVLERSFGSWEDAAAGVKPKAIPMPVFPATQRVLLLPEAGATQAIINVARAAPGFDDPAQPDAVAVSQLLGGDFLSRLNTVLREEKGYSYGVDSSVWQTIRGGTAMVVNAAVEVGVTGEALGEILDGFAELETVPVTGAELNRSITSYLTAIASNAETAEGLMGGMLSSIGSGLTLEEMYASQVKMTTLAVADVDAEAKRMAGLDRAVILIAGDPDKILPQLTALGLTDVTILPRDRP